MNLSTLKQEWSAEKSSGNYVKKKTMSGKNGRRYDDEFKNKVLATLDKSLNFKAAQIISGVADSTIRRWYREAHTETLIND